MENNSVFQSWEDYYIPGTTVLRNKFVTTEMPYGVSDQMLLTMMEERYTSQRFLELMENPLEGSFDYEHMKAIHFHLFQDVYEWAGQERTAPVGAYMAKVARDVVNYPLGDPNAPLREYTYYPAGSELTEAAEAQYAKIKELNYLRSLDKHTFAQCLGEIWGELNVVHSFREGNTRSQFAFFTQLARQAGWVINPKHFLPGTSGRDEFVAARFHCQATGTSTRLAALLDKEISPLSATYHLTQTSTKNTQYTAEQFSRPAQPIIIPPKGRRSMEERMSYRKAQAMASDPEAVTAIENKLRNEPPTRGLSR